VKNNVKSRAGAESYSASEAAALLGISIPTLKRMVAEGRLESFRTPGGHLRISGDSVAAVRERRPERLKPVRDPSPVLQNRRERLEELTLEAQEMRARRGLARLQREEREEVEQQEAEDEARELEAQERQAELELEREQLEHASEQERARKETAQAIAAFRCHWLEEANQALADPQCSWLSATQKKEIVDAVEVEIERRKPRDSPRMVIILVRLGASPVRIAAARFSASSSSCLRLSSAFSQLRVSAGLANCRTGQDSTNPLRTTAALPEPIRFLGAIECVAGVNE
jgi:excisionase family DNA binding protein